MKKITPCEARHAFLCRSFPEALYPFRVNDRHACGARVTIAADCTLTSVAAPLPGWSGQMGYAEMAFFRWDTDYETTVAGTPVCTCREGGWPDNARVTFRIPAGVVTGGDWLILLRNGEGNPIGMYFAARPDDDPDADIRVVTGYTDGKAVDESPRVFVTYRRMVPTESADLPLTGYTPGRAHVIFLSGQSNASGQSMQDIYKSHADPAVYARFEAGYPNILIDVAVDGGTVETNGFVPVSFGQGGTPERFGPELGLAQYLDEHFPGETFYIIKSSWSGAGLAAHFCEGNEICEYVRTHTQASMARLLDAGLDPEVFAILWMQGETDAWSVSDTLNYGRNLGDLYARMCRWLYPHTSPNGPAFIDAAISETWAWTLNELINVEKEAFCATSPNFTYIDTVTPGLGCYKENDDIAHYDSDDMIALGRMFGEAVEAVIRRA